GEDVVETFGERLHLRKLRHATTVRAHGANTPSADPDVSRLLRRRGGATPVDAAEGPARLRGAADGRRLQGLLRRPQTALRAVVPRRRFGGRVPPRGQRRRRRRGRPARPGGQAERHSQTARWRRTARTVRTGLD